MDCYVVVINERHFGNHVVYYEGMRDIFAKLLFTKLNVESLTYKDDRREVRPGVGPGGVVVTGESCDMVDD